MSTNIPIEWIKKYIDSLLEGAKAFGPETAMGRACMERADHIMDMVKRWKDREKGD